MDKRAVQVVPFLVVLGVTAGVVAGTAGLTSSLAILLNFLSVHPGSLTRSSDHPYPPGPHRLAGRRAIQSMRIKLAYSRKRVLLLC